MTTGVGGGVYPENTKYNHNTHTQTHNNTISISSAISICWTPIQYCIVSKPGTYRVRKVDPNFEQPRAVANAVERFQELEVPSDGQVHDVLHDHVVDQADKVAKQAILFDGNRVGAAASGLLLLELDDGLVLAGLLVEAVGDERFLVEPLHGKHGRFADFLDHGVGLLHDRLQDLGRVGVGLALDGGEALVFGRLFRRVRFLLGEAVEVHQWDCMDLCQVRLHVQKRLAERAAGQEERLLQVVALAAVDSVCVCVE